VRPHDRLLAAVTDRLAAAGCVAADEEAAELVAAAPDAAALEALLRRREEGEPLAWLTGTIVFCDRPLRVAPGVFEPRAQTEELARRAAAALPEHGRAADLCTGSGAVAAHLRASVPSATVVGVDLDPQAAACARSNGVHAVVGDVDGPLGGAGTWDVVTAVAPYVPTGSLGLLPRDVQRWEPTAALDGGPDGLDLVARVVAAAGRLLRPGGRLLVEIGGEQDVGLAPALAAAGLGAVTTWRDEDGDLRGLTAMLTAGPGR
jgi:release factor glutamine methyltransferase